MLRTPAETETCQIYDHDTSWNLKYFHPTVIIINPYTPTNCL